MDGETATIPALGSGLVTPDPELTDSQLNCRLEKDELHCYSAPD